MRYHPPMSRSIAAAGIAAGSLVVLLLGIVPNWWFVGGMKTEFGSEDDDHLELSFGLTAVEACSGKQCGEMDYDGMPAPNGDDDGAAEAAKFRRFVWAGAATFWGGIAVVFAIGGALLLWLIRLRLPASPATIGGALAVGVAIAAGLAFVLKPELPQLMFLRGELELRMSLGLPLTLLGCAGCAIGGFLLARDEQAYPPIGALRVAPQAQVLPGVPAPPPHAATMAPACPRCNAPTLYVAEHQRHFCSSCRAYL